MFLFIEWLKCHLALKIRPNLHEFRNVVRAYKEPQRFYHVVKHLIDSIGFFNKHFDKLQNGAVVKLALFYHDIKYDPSKHDNEEQSIVAFLDYARRARISLSIQSDVVRLIRATIKHDVDKEDLLGCAMIDSDMSIFAAEAEEYLQYAKNVAKEYYLRIGHENYLVGRTAFLTSLDPKSVFKSEVLRDALTFKVMRNINSELTLLKENPLEIFSK